MARADETGDDSEDGEMLPDEREAIAERIETLADDARRSLAEVVESLESNE
jgi:hypothetical protein